MTSPQKLERNNPLQLFTDFPAQVHAGLQYASSDEILKVQTRLFLDHLSYTLSGSRFYQASFKAAGVDIDDIRTLSDITALPITEKSDLENTELLCCADQRQIVDICLTSGTSGGEATIIPQTASDLSRLAYNEQLAFGMAGITDTDTLIVCAAIDRCFMAGLAYFMGGTKVSASVVRAGSGSAAQLWELTRRTNATAMVGVPSLMHKIGSFSLENGYDPAASSVKKLIAIGEPTRDASLSLLPMSHRLETMWGAAIYSTYASSEMATTFCECEARAGGHLRPEMIIVEILDDRDRPVPDGELGEVVVTPLGVTGMPLIRFRTGDLSYMITQPCACGRTTPRLAPISGRKHQMLKYKGTTLFPNAILGALEGNEKFHGGYVEARLNDDGTDRVCLVAALKNHPEHSGCDAVPGWMTEHLQAVLRVVPEIKIVPAQQVDQKVYQLHKKRKRITFFDLR